MNKQIWLLIMRSGNDSVNVFAYDSKGKATERFSECISEIKSGLLKDKLKEMTEDKEDKLDWSFLQTDSWFHFKNIRDGLIYDLRIDCQQIQ